MKLKRFLAGLLLGGLLWSQPLQALTIYFADSADHYTALADIDRKWTSHTGSGVTLPAIEAGTGRKGTNALRLTSGEVHRTIGGVSTIDVAMAIKLPSAPGSGTTFIQFSNGSTIHVCGLVKGNLTIEFRVAACNGTVLGTTAAALTAGVYTHVEIKVVVHDTTGSITMKWNEASVLALTNVDTRNGATTTVDDIAINGPVASTLFDDVLFADDFVGDKTVTYLPANGTGNYSQWTRFGGGSANYEAVDDTAPDGSTTYNYTSTLNQIDTYQFADLAAGQSIIAVQTVMYLTKSDSGTRGVSPLLRISSTDYVGTEVAPSDSSYNYFLQVYMTSPATATTWGLSELNGTEFGPKLTQ